LNKITELCDQLARLVDRALLSQSQFEDIALGLSKTERRLWAFLGEYEQARASEIRRMISISNISRTAQRINEKLAAVGDSRRIVAERATITDEYGISSSESFWRLDDNEKGWTGEQAAT